MEYTKFISTNEVQFKEYIKDHKDKHEIAFIYGNAPNLKLIDNNWNKQIKEEFKSKIFTMGLNRSYSYVDSDILLYTDQKMETELHSNPPFDCGELIKVTKNDNMANLEYWRDHKKFRQDNYNVLPVFRNILISALYMCYLLNVKKIVLFGVQMDNRKYFYGTHVDGYNPEKPYDEVEVLGYTVHKIMKETVEYFFSNNLDIYYTGDSEFLQSLKGLKHIDVEKIKELIC